MGCGCIIALIGMAAPRFAIFLLWLFSDRMAIAFNGFFEAFLDGDWYLFDPTGMAPATGLVRICAGRDAADAPFATLA